MHLVNLPKQTDRFRICLDLLHVSIWRVPRERLEKGQEALGEFQDKHFTINSYHIPVEQLDSL